MTFSGRSSYSRGLKDYTILFPIVIGLVILGGVAHGIWWSFHQKQPEHGMKPSHEEKQ
jgi:hypothetical protein